MATVVLLHGLLLGAAWSGRVALSGPEQSPLIVTLLSEPMPTPEQAPRIPKPMLSSVKVEAVLVDELPALQIAVAEDAPAVVPMQSQAAEATDPPVLASVQTVTQNLGTELAVQCPERNAPRYPTLARRQREQGEVRLRVELDESGRIESVSIVSSSGSSRLDEAARLAIESWRCRPAQLNGRPVRAVALQSLAFVLERR